MSNPIQNQPIFDRMYPMQDFSLPTHVVQVSTPQEPVYNTRKYRWLTISFTINMIFWLLAFVECYMVSQIGAEGRNPPPMLNALILLAYGIFLAPIVQIILSTLVLTRLSGWGYSKSSDFVKLRRSSIASIVFCALCLVSMIIAIAASNVAKDLGSVFFLLLLAPLASAASFIPALVNTIFAWKMLVSTKSDPKHLAVTASVIAGVIALAFAIFSLAY